MSEHAAKVIEVERFGQLWVHRLSCGHCVTWRILQPVGSAQECPDCYKLSLRDRELEKMPRQTGEYMTRPKGGLA